MSETPVDKVADDVEDKGVNEDLVITDTLVNKDEVAEE